MRSYSALAKNIGLRLVQTVLRNTRCRRRRSYAICLVLTLPCIGLLLNLAKFPRSPPVFLSHELHTSLRLMRDQWQQPVPLSPLLQQLVIAEKHLTASGQALSSAHNCPSVSQTPNVARQRTPSDHVIFQKMVPDSNAVYLFSAYLDRRWQPTPVVIIIGLSEMNIVSPKYCQIWYHNDVSDAPHVTLAQVRYSYETHGRR